MADVMKFTDDNFDQNVLQSSEPVLVDFWAVWCGPCRAIAPSVEAISQEYNGKARVGKLDIDENPRVAANYGIRSIPTLLIFKDGKVVEQIVGAVPKQTIVNALNNHLSPATVA